MRSEGLVKAINPQELPADKASIRQKLELYMPCEFKYQL
jgi:hypothetical protein